MTMNADLTVSDVAKYLGPPSISVHPDTRVATGPVFHTVCRRVSRSEFSLS